MVLLYVVTWIPSIPQMWAYIYIFIPYMDPMGMGKSTITMAILNSFLYVYQSPTISLDRTSPPPNRSRVGAPLWPSCHMQHIVLSIFIRRSMDWSKGKSAGNHENPYISICFIGKFHGFLQIFPWTNPLIHRSQRPPKLPKLASALLGCWRRVVHHSIDLVCAGAHTHFHLGTRFPIFFCENLRGAWW